MNAYVADSEQNGDTENYPQSLKGRRGQTTDNANLNDNDSNGPTQQWTDLHDSWNAVLE